MVQDSTGFHTEGSGYSTEEFQKEAKNWWLSGIDALSTETAELELLGVLFLPGSAPQGLGLEQGSPTPASPTPVVLDQQLFSSPQGR